MTKNAAEQWPLRRGSLIYPTPVAKACGSVLRARNLTEIVGACLKAGEVLTRYLAAVAVASVASREEEGKVRLSDLKGNLSFGHFLTTVQEVAGAKVKHPAAALLAQGFRPRKQNKETLRGKTDQALVSLLELRNELGHKLSTLNEARAKVIEAKYQPRDLLIDALEGVEDLLSKPLFVVEEQAYTKEALVWRRLLLMGESSDPVPEFIKIGIGTGGVEKTNCPYLAIDQLCLQLPPWLLWGIDHKRQNFALQFLDSVEGTKARFCTLEGNKEHQNQEFVQEIQELFRGARRAADTVVLLDGRPLTGEWLERKKSLEQAGLQQEGFIDWQALEPATLQWYAGILEPGTKDVQATITNRLLDGRSQLQPNELRQLRLLFGRPATVRSELQRDVLDLRVIDPHTLRPSKREIVESLNLFETLKRAIQFFTEQTGMDSVAPEELRKTEGTLKYLTLREIFVNQTVHQDYRDASAPGQIEFQAEKMTVFNKGYSLVPAEKLLTGGQSQSRNPLIARALRLIGFAEISGSGLRALHRACQQAQRRPPTFESDETANTFSLTLDWSQTAMDVDVYWKSFLGLQLNTQQAAVLNALASVPSATIAMIESTTALDAEMIAQALDFLVFQRVVEQDEATYRLARHLREKLG